MCRFIVRMPVGAILALSLIGAMFIAISSSPPVSAGFVRLSDLEKEAAKSPPAIAAFFRKIVKAAEQPDGAEAIEQKGLSLVTELLKDKDVPIEQALPAAEMALQTLAWFHETNSMGDSPNEVKRRLDEKLLEVRQRHLLLLTEQAKQAGMWNTSLTLADRMLDKYPRNLAVGKQVRRLWADCALAEKDLGKVRKLWLRCQDQFLDSPEMHPVQELLQKQAQRLLDEAAPLGDGPARAKLTQALSLWPRLPGLRDASLRRQKKYLVLYVGVRQLPEFLAPATAWTGAEKHTVDLLFESLFQPADAPDVGQNHEARLAARLPEPQPLKRRISLRHDVYWSNGERVVPADVRHAVQLLTDGNLAGRASTWLDFLEVPEVDGSSFTLDFLFKQGMFDPLSLLSFKILPQTFRDKPLNRGDDAEFAKSPVGSGPFVYLGKREIEGRTCAVFTSNPNYVRGDRPNEPHVREIRLFAWKDLKELAFSEARNALLLDVPTDLVSALTNRGTHQVRTIRPKRVHFLALNQRLPVLADDSLRRALAHAIDREAILQRYFRGARVDPERLAPLGAALTLPLLSVPQRHADVHRILNGPYPPDSWASSPGVARDLLDLSLARSLFRQAIKDQKIKLTLKHPDDDPRLARACRDLAGQVENAAADAGVALQLIPMGLPPRAMKEAVDRRDYELAYYHWDYESANFWLWPLFDPQPAAVQPGGSNFLGYDNDAPLQNLFRSALAHRQFSALQEATHNIHAYLVQKKMPLIPLWQLDAHLAIPAGLTTGAIDPLRVFSRVGQWHRNGD